MVPDHCNYVSLYFLFCLRGNAPMKVVFTQTLCLWKRYFQHFVSQLDEESSTCWTNGLKQFFQSTVLVPPVQMNNYLNGLEELIMNESLRASFSLLGLKAWIGLKYSKLSLEVLFVFSYCRLFCYYWYSIKTWRSLLSWHRDQQP